MPMELHCDSGGCEVQILADFIVAQVDKSAGNCFIFNLSPLCVEALKYELMSDECLRNYNAPKYEGSIPSNVKQLTE